MEPNEIKRRIVEMLTSGASPLEVSDVLQKEGTFLLPSDIVRVYNEYRESILEKTTDRDNTVLETITPLSVLDRVMKLINRIEEENLSSRNAITLATLYRTVGDMLKLHHNIRNANRDFEEEVSRRVDAILEDWEKKRLIIEEASNLGIINFSDDENNDGD